MGLGTDEASVRYLLQENAFGTRRVAVVRDIFDRDVKRRHLVRASLGDDMTAH